MKKFLTVVIAAIFSSTLFAQQPTIKDENVQAREVKAFHSIRVSHAFDVYLTQSNEEGLAVSASDQKYIDQIKTEVRDGELHIWVDGKMRWGGKMKLKAYVSFKNIDKLNVSGACDVRIIGTLKANDLEVKLSGASDIDGRIEANKLSFNLSGASDVKISGSATKVNIDGSGASSFKGFDFKVDYCDAHVSGASDIKITVNKELSARASGASDINYKGEGMIRDIKTSGASSVSRS